MKNAATETIRSLALLAIAAFPTVALIASFPSHAQTRETAADGAIATDDDAQRERRCERTRRIGKVTQTRCD